MHPRYYRMHHTHSQLFHDDLCDSISYLCEIDIVAGKLDLYISQAYKRAFSWTSCVRKNKKRPAWFDSECRLKRSLAIKAGERVTNIEQKQRQQDACRRYRACKQKKQRIYSNKCIGDIKSAFNTNCTDQICGVLFSVSVKWWKSSDSRPFGQLISWIFKRPQLRARRCLFWWWAGGSGTCIS